jgi:hypothetical protein
MTVAPAGIWTLPLTPTEAIAPLRMTITASLIGGLCGPGYTTPPETTPTASGVCRADTPTATTNDTRQAATRRADAFRMTALDVPAWPKFSRALAVADLPPARDGRARWLSAAGGPQLDRRAKQRVPVK